MKWSGSIDRYRLSFFGLCMKVVKNKFDWIITMYVFFSQLYSVLILVRAAFLVSEYYSLHSVQHEIALVLITKWLFRLKPTAQKNCFWNQMFPAVVHHLWTK